jgi:catechol 2,3-dioxygenase-like lactoylglutathione lyase family enzyme
MTLLDHAVLQVDDLNAIGDWYDQVVSLAGGTRTFDTATLIGYALPGQPTQLLFSLATDPGGRQTHLAHRVEDEATVRRGHEFAWPPRFGPKARRPAAAGGTINAWRA